MRPYLLFLSVYWGVVMTIARYLPFAIYFVLSIFGWSSAVSAGEPVVPDRRAVLIRNMDFPGKDLAPIFETTFDSCLKSCLKDNQCKAFTYNFKSNACFPKTGVGEMTPFEGAVSARIIPTDPKVLKIRDQRLAQLSLLPPRYLKEAGKVARDMGRNYLANQWKAEDFLAAASKATASKDLNKALKLVGAAVGVSDAPEHWLFFGRIAGAVTANSYKEKQRLKRLRTAAAINAFLRATTPDLQATALRDLADALAARSDGRRGLSILRLAQEIYPSPKTADKIARFVELYGFRVVEHQVDNNAALPRICATFSEDLVAAGVDYADYVQLPEPGLAVETQGRQLCVEGVSRGKTHVLRFRKGMPAASGEKLVKPITLKVYVRDRDPSAHFVGRAYVLPRGKTATIPIVTVNLSEVDLKIHRVVDRNLVRAFRKGYFGRALSPWDERDIVNSLGEEVWAGRGKVELQLNKEVVTALPIGDVISDFKPGVYVMRARVPGADPYDRAAAAQWFIVTDLGISTMKGGDGLHVFLRSLRDASATAGARVRLIARNNDILAEAVTDAKGYAHFAPGLLAGRAGKRVQMITVEKQDDFAFLNLTDPAFDLSDRGVAGRKSPPPIDVFMTTERGAYRPGETVFLTALVRDSRAEALQGLALTAIITRPDGVEFTRRQLPDLGAGGHVLELPLPKAAMRGTWTVNLHADPKAPPLASGKFLVEDLMPDRVEFDIDAPKRPVHLGKNPVIGLSARYLYGAPAAGLNIEAEARLHLAEGLKGFPGYRFGRYDQPFNGRLEYTKGNLQTDADGKARFGLTMPRAGDVSRPLSLTAIVRLREGSGRPVERSIELPVAPSHMVIGIRPLFDGDLPEGANAAFDVIAVGPDLEQQAMPAARWVLNRIRTRYQWYESFGEWNYEPVTTRVRVAGGEIAAGTRGPVRIEVPVDWGHYELRVETTGANPTISSTDFRAGWYASAASVNTPDALEIGLDKDKYRVGDTARLRLVPRSSGVALIAVMSNHLIDMKTVKVVKGENLVDLDVTEDWGAGAYVTATVIRPMDTEAGHNPARAIGLNWAQVDPQDHRLRARLITAPESAPRGPMRVRLKVDGVRPGETAYATIAAVDVGILNLTRFQAPDPDAHYFGQRRLGMQIRDMYGRLIDGTQGNPGQLRSGGDGAMAERLQSPPPTEELVAYFSGPLTVGPDGTVETSFEMPEFNGTVRLMAVVWSKTGVGQASTDVLVRDPIVLTASLPRFLAPGDESRLLLEIAHATGPEGEVALDVSASGGLYLDKTALPASVRLAKGQRVRLSVPMVAPAMGNPEITVNLVTPDGRNLSKTLVLPVRINDPEIAFSSQVMLGDGKTLTLSADVFDGMQPGSGRATLAVGPIARFDTPGLLAALDRYPYGCTEQITSKALPLLYFDEVADAMGLGGHRNVETRVRQAITEVLLNQSSRGSFGLWSPDSGDLWLDAYVSDFLSRARAKGYEVPDLAFKLAMQNLQNRVNYAGDFKEGGEGVAYALMVLAREGAANIGDLRYYADTRADQFGTPLALAQLGAALAYYGDQKRADAMFRKAGRFLEKRRNTAEKALWRVDYGTDLRDTAAVLTLAVEVGSEAIDQQALAARLAPDALTGRSRSTQENMWSLLAANALIQETPADAFLVNGRPADGPVVQMLEAQTAGDRVVRVTNNSGKPTETVLTIYGVPKTPVPAGGKGYKIERSYYDMEGKPLDISTLRLNQRMVVVLTVTPLQRIEARLMVNDPLPAGFEIDNPHLLRAGDIGALDWLGKAVNARHVEFRADRFLAAIDWTKEKSFRLAYVVRAISPGQFHHPAASVEDMYRPEYRARTDAGQVVISER